MNAQQFNSPLFLSFEIADRYTLKIFSAYGRDIFTLKAMDDETRQFAQLFYEFNGGMDFYESCLFIHETGCKIADFATLNAIPKQYDEPAEMPEHWAFSEWLNALRNTLQKDGFNDFTKAMGEYFNA